MKKTLLLVTACALIALTLALTLTVFVGAAENQVTVNGSTSLETALNNVANKGTIVIDGTYTIPTGFNWPKSTKEVTITGGVLDFTNYGAGGHFNIYSHVTFSDIELKFATIDWNAEGDDSVNAKSNGGFKRTNIYANGCRVTIDSNVTFTEGATNNTNVCLFGGSNGGTVNGDTHLTVLAGWYTYIFGGGHGGTVNGSTYVTVGGTVNSTAQISNHKSNYNVYGGGWDDNITGSSNLTIQGSAKMIYAYGGSHGGSSKIGGTSNVFMNGGTLMSIYGANNSGANTGTAANVLMTGGTVDQIFGASNGASYGTAEKPVNVTVTLKGGTVTRRVYGGCYNEFKSGEWYEILVGNYGKWATTRYQVYGHITVIISDGCNISYSYSDGIATADKALYARSRLSTYNGSGALPTADETSTLIFLNSFQSNKLKAQDGTMKSIMSSVPTAADEIHTLTYSANGAVITQSCNGSGHSDDASSATAQNAAHTIATATLRTTYDATYTGSAIENVEIVYSDGWMLDPLSAITYTSNVNVGTATASASCNGVTATLQFTIGKQALATPSASLFTVTNESIKGKADGAISGLTTAMEYSTDGVTYTAATGDLSALPSGTYYVRYAADAEHSASLPVTLTIANGRMLKVTFKVAGGANIVKEVTWNATLTDIPAIPTRPGYDRTAPYWSMNGSTPDFSNIRSDMTVEAVYTINTYTITFVIDGQTAHTVTVNHGEAISGVPQIPAKVGYDKTAPRWDKTLSYAEDDMTVTAVYTVNVYTVTFRLSSDSTYKTVTVEHGSPLTKVPTIPSKTGFSKVSPKWVIKDTEIEADFSSITSDMEILAKYVLDVYNVTFVVDGEVIDTVTVKYGSAINRIPTIPEKKGYDKIAPTWDKDLTTISGDMTVTAVYTKNPAGIATDTTKKDESVALGDGWKEQLLTDADKEKLEDGDSIKVYLEAENTTLTDAELTAMEAVLDGYTAEHFLSLSLYKKIGSANATRVEGTDGALTVTIKLPKSVIAEGRSYKLIAIKNGEATEVEAVCEDDTMTVVTDDFNTVYAISYLDAQPDAPVDGENGNNSTVIIIAVIAAVMVVGGGATAGIVISISKKKKKA